jgi:hypothetical protein
MREKQNDKAFANTFSALINELRMQGVCTWGWVESEAFAHVSRLNQVKTLMQHRSELKPLNVKKDEQ